MSSTNNQPDNISRRNFMRQAACAALGATAMVNTLSSLKLTSAALAQGSTQNDYKALVCLFLSGGNDSNNLLVPTGQALSGSLRKDYEDGRGLLALTNQQLTPINVSNSAAAFREYHGGTVSQMGVHGDADDISTLFDDGELAFICNVGTLAHPIPSRSAYLNQTVPLPRDLFSHSDQTMEWQTSIADKPTATGWGGRMAQELLNSQDISLGSKVSISISMAGANTFQRADRPEVTAFNMRNGLAKPFEGFGSASKPYNRAYHEGATFEEPQYTTSRYGHRLKALESLIKLTNDNLLEDEYASRLVNSRSTSDLISKALVEADVTSIDFDTIFANADHPLGDQLKGVAQLIAARSALENNRQIFFVNVGGYDIHQNHLASHSDLMQELSTGLKAFRDALVTIGDWGKVVTYTASDFSRTFAPNRPDDDAGTDHAWGGHAMVMGGPVAGGKLYGHYPSLKLGDHAESIDAHNGRGRWIPSTSVDQYSAVLARWFGVDSNSMEAIFPNLSRFDDPVSTTLANMRFIEGI